MRSNVNSAFCSVKIKIATLIKLGKEWCTNLITTAVDVLKDVYKKLHYMFILCSA